jgi:hypothetical protein
MRTFCLAEGPLSSDAQTSSGSQSPALSAISCGFGSLANRYPHPWLHVWWQIFFCIKAAVTTPTYGGNLGYAG